MAEESLSVRYLKGVGEKRAALYAKLGVETIGELVRYFPRGYIDISKPYFFREAPRGEKVAVRGAVIAKTGEMRIRKGLSVFKVTVTDGESDMVITFFNAKYTVESLKIGKEYIFYGVVGGGFVTTEMSSPMVITLDGTDKMVAQYSLTAGLTSKMISANVRSALDKLEGQIHDPMSEDIRKKFSLCGLEYALRNIHFPQSASALKAAKERIVFDEALEICVGMAMARRKNAGLTGEKMEPKGMNAFFEALPFDMTFAQRRAVAEITEDMCKNAPMNRLLQGDVGSGKTAVGAAAAYFAYRNGHQTALMAPTEILAQQHYEALSKMLGSCGMKTELLTGSVTAKRKKEIYQKAEQGEIDLLVGTHALIESGVNFKSLGLIVTDEMHRFGVSQRINLNKKGKNPHTLVMSATPIPRTLAYVIYGDLDASVLDELPKGRTPIKSYFVGGDKRLRAYGFIKKQLDEGKKGYIICPLVEAGEEDTGELFNVEEYAEELRRGEFANYSVGVIHGKMKAAEKDAVMREFKDGDIDLLVATTVIEVGIDVPEATVILIENAERFGMSQLHQLRGRVGRGKDQSYCILVSDAKNQVARERLKTIASTTDGFKIAKEDLRMRGPGDFFGYRQHGAPAKDTFELQDNEELLTAAKEAAADILAEDPELERRENSYLKLAAEKICEVAAR